MWQIAGVLTQLQHQEGMPQQKSCKQKLTLKHLGSKEDVQTERASVLSLTAFKTAGPTAPIKLRLATIVICMRGSAF